MSSLKSAKLRHCARQLSGLADITYDRYIVSLGLYITVLNCADAKSVCIVQMQQFMDNL